MRQWQRFHAQRVSIACWIVVFYSLLFMVKADADTSFELKTAAQNSPPKYLSVEDGQISGVCTDIIQAVMEIDPGIRIHGHHRFMPFKRILLNLEHGVLDVFFCMKPTAERQTKYRFISFPLYSLSYRLAVLESDTLQVSSLEELAWSLNSDVVSVSGTGAERYIETALDRQVTVVRNPEAMMNMLLLRRARIAFYHDLGMNYLIHKHHWQNRFKLLPNRLSTYHHSVAFSKSVPDFVVTRVERALKLLFETGKINSIYQKYGVSSSSQ